MLARRGVAVVAAAAGLAHGAKGANGRVVVPLEAPVDGVSHGCVDVDPALGTDVADNPKDCYFNIHTTVFPAGALRAQLR
jgi:hypothetical protein